MADTEPKNHSEKSARALREEEILKFWKENTIFQKTLDKTSPRGEFVFYDGPPFATGLPHYGHLVGGTMKDVIPRFKTMQGFHVPRRWGWDTHGLPIENLIEKELGLKSKKDIEELGVEKFNEAARAAVLRYDKEWKEIIPRTGRFVDMDNAYVTMDPKYSESIWWSFKTLHDKGLIYNGFKSMMLCPHCGTTLSNFEVAQGYKDITDISVYVKFELLDEPGTFVLAWTTTPWTLPGNVALAVGKDIQYVKVETEGVFYILAKERLVALKDKKYETVEEFKGEKLVGKKYKPLFGYYKDADLKNKENAWKVAAADFVTTTDGTGVVHIAPAFGEDDYQLALKENLPFIQHVATDGTFKKEVIDFAGQLVKPKDDHQKADIEIIKYLAKQGTLFAKEKLIHSYPHCWRCDTPLLNYATSSWFVKVTDIKEKLVAENNKVNWVPKEIGEGRFGKWLENARDWAISRSRYWGAPLPVWICKECNATEVVGSVDALKEKLKRNKYIIARHGEAEQNKLQILSSTVDAPYGLTEKGKEQVAEAVKKLKGRKVDYIFSSDFVRTRETAQILAQAAGISESEIIYDKRLREYNVGDYDGKPVTEWFAYWQTRKPGDTATSVPNGESPDEVHERIGSFLYDIDSKYKDKTILVVSHQDPLWYVNLVADGKSSKNAYEPNPSYVLQTGEIRDLSFVQIPHNARYELDLHRPYIDKVEFGCSCGGTFKRVPEVFDTWYESGSMPFASGMHPERFPADFIAEGQDQTRGWFYSLLVLSTALFGKAPYKNVVVNGTVLAEDGQKMSKRLQNYPELSYVLDRYGADAMRYYLLASPAVHAEDLSFSEKGVDEVAKKHMLRLDNVCTFFLTYADEHELSKGIRRPDSKNILDRWILARLDETIKTMTDAFEKYLFDRAVWPIADFVDDLSTWYLRRSRDRFKGDDVHDKQHALETTRFVLVEFSKLIAPAMPFLAEDVYQKMKGVEKSVHLESWPVAEDVDNEVIEHMASIRKVISLGLELRSRSGIKVRQPLASFTSGTEIKRPYADIVKDELNVKHLHHKKEFAESNPEKVELDLEVTPELKLEGQARELIRALQDMRKKMQFSPTDKVVLKVVTDKLGKNLLETFALDISRTAQLKDILFVKEKEISGEDIVVDDVVFTVQLEK